MNGLVFAAITVSREQLQRFIYHSNLMMAGLVGFLVGIIFFAVMVYVIETIRFRNVKEYLFRVNNQKDFETWFFALRNECDTMSNVTNLKFFKSLSNDLTRLRSYLSRYWME
jgi:hypothetical protein